MEGQAMIAGPMVMATFEAGAGITEQQRSRIHERASLLAAIEERACENDRDGRIVMLLLESPVMGTEAADDVVDAPAIALGHTPGGWNMMICRG
jgi:hypothetical protein